MYPIQSSVFCTIIGIPRLTYIINIAQKLIDYIHCLCGLK